MKKKQIRPQVQPVRREIPRLDPEADRGLSTAQARELAAAGWDNRPVESPTKSDKQIIRENLLTYFNLIFVVLAVCLLLVGDWRDTVSYTHLTLPTICSV